MSSPRTIALGVSCSVLLAGVWLLMWLGFWKAMELWGVVDVACLAAAWVVILGWVVQESGLHITRAGRRNEDDRFVSPGR